MAVLAVLHPITASAQGTGTWNGGAGEWITINPTDWILVDFTSPWGTFPDGQVFTFINSGQVNLQQKSLFDEELEQWVPINAISVAGLTVGSPATLYVTGSTTFTAGGFLGIDSNVLNDGLIQFENTANLVSPLLLTIAGDGTIFLRGDPAGGSDENSIIGPGTIFHVGDHTITGRGTISTAYFHNEATVQASLAGQTLRVTSLFLANSGLMRAVNGAVLRLTPTGSMENTGVVEATGGVVEIDTPDLENDGTLAVADDTGAVLRLEDTDVDNSGGLLSVGRLGVMELHHGTTIRGGTMTAVDTGLFRVASGEATLRDAISLTGRLQVTGATSLELNGAAITQPAGTLEVLGGGLMRVSGASSITGGLLTGAGQFTAAGGLGLHGGAGGLRIEGLDVQVGGVPLATSATIENNTTITVAPSATMQTGGNTLLTGTGDWVFTPAFDFFGVPAPASYATVGQTGGGALTLDTGARIRGSARLGINQIDVVNRGVIRADAAGGGAIQLEFSGRTLTNENLIESAGTGRIDVLAGTYLNEAGVFRAGSGTDIAFHSDATVRGGTVESLGTGVLKVMGAGATFDGYTDGAITFSGLVQTAASSFTLLGQVINHALWEIGDGQWQTPVEGLTLGGTGTMRGTGTLNSFGASVPYNPNTQVILGGQLLNEAGHTLAGAMQIYAAGGLVNEGLILADDPREVTGYLRTHHHPLWISPGGTAVVNRGTLAASGLAHLVLEGGTYENDGGLIEARPGGTVDLWPGVVIRGGVIDSSGSGRVRTSTYEEFPNGSAVVRLDPGADGPVEIRGTLYHEGGNVLAFEEQLNVTGTLEIGAGLRLRGEAGGGAEAVLAGGGSTLGRTGSGILTAPDGDTLRIAAGHTVRGQLQLQFQAAHLVNDGAIWAENLGSGSLSIQLRDHNLINRGTLGSRNGGTLSLTSSGPAILDNTGGAFVAEAGTAISLSSSTIRGGALEGEGYFVTPLGQQVHLDGSTGGPMTIASTLYLRTGTGSGGPFVPAFTRFHGGFINNGLISGDNTGHISIATGQTTTFSGTGGIMLGDALGRGTISGDPTGTLVLGAGQVLSGGYVMSGSFNLTNQGTIRSDNAAQFGIFDNTGQTWLNQGLIEAVGAPLRLGSGTIDQTGGGLLRARDGGWLQAWGGTIKGGRIETAPGSSVWVADSTLRLQDGVTLDGQLSVATGGVLYLAGTNTNDGLLHTSVNARIHPLAGGATLNGTGRIEVRNNASTTLNPQIGLPGGPLTLGAGQTVFVESGSFFYLYLPVNGDATWDVDGTVVTFIEGALNLGTNGRLEGTGTVHLEGVAVHSIAGTVAPGGDDIGTLTINSPSRTLNLTAGSVLEFGLGGAGAGQADRLHFGGGTNNFASEIGVTFLNGFLPEAGDVFDLITGSGLSGSFSNVLDGRLDVAGYGSFAVDFTGTYLRLSDFALTAVPEPAEVGLILGLIALAALGWRRQRRG